jgi:hypothetical protein
MLTLYTVIAVLLMGFMAHQKMKARASPAFAPSNPTFGFTAGYPMITAIFGGHHLADTVGGPVPLNWSAAEVDRKRGGSRPDPEELAHRRVFEDSLHSFVACDDRTRALSLRVTLLTRHPGYRRSIRAAFEQAYPKK